jgi:mRNA interferase MazF
VVIRQGDVYWIDLGQPSGSGPGFLHPHVVIQNDVYNQSRLQTVVVCGITSSFRQAGIPGNVSLDPGEANLPKPSVVNVSQLFTVDKEDLIEKVGALSPERIQEVLDGVYLLLEPREVDS